MSRAESLLADLLHAEGVVERRRCQGTRYCETKTDRECGRCGRALCEDHVEWTMCSPKGKHRMRAIEKEDPCD